MGDREKGQVSTNATKLYEDKYVPALFQEWCPLAIQAAGIKMGNAVVDIACGTGALAIAASEHVGPKGKTIGVDVNKGMLSIARSKSSTVEWLNALAEKLPFADNSFNCVVSQFGLMYFENQEAAIGEMIRVLQPGGAFAIVVWDMLDNNPGLAAEEFLWQKVFSGEVDESPYRLGDKEDLHSLLKALGVNDIQIDTHKETACFDSIKDWIHTGAKGWTEDDMLSDDQLKLLLDTAEKELTSFRTNQGTVSFPTFAHIITVMM